MHKLKYAVWGWNYQNSFVCFFGVLRPDSTSSDDIYRAPHFSFCLSTSK